jgi:hypothetical protein
LTTTGGRGIRGKTIGGNMKETNGGVGELEGKMDKGRDFQSKYAYNTQQTRFSFCF